MTVGERLAAARMRAGLSIDELSAATRIRPGLLGAMESDDFTRCGGNVYARGHLRLIARALDIDPEPLVSEFDESHAAEPVSRSRRQERAEAKPPTVHPARPRWSVVIGAILVGLMGWGMVRLFTLPSDIEASASRTTPTPLVTPSAPRITVTPSRPGNPGSTTRPSRPPRLVRLTLSGAYEGTYVTLRNHHGEQLFSGRLRSGSSQSITYGGLIKVVLDTPRNVRIFVNGQRVYPKAHRFTVRLTGAIEKPDQS